MRENMMKLVSACLVGINCRYDGKNKLDKKLLKLFKQGKLIPVCPEQLGGLTTPRIPAEQLGEKVITKDGQNVTENFIKGAKETLKIAKQFEIKEAILKSKSPSCGFGEIYDGTFSGKTKKGNGITADMLHKAGIKIKAV